MTLQEALKYDNLLKHNLMEKAATLNLSEETARLWINMYL